MNAYDVDDVIEGYLEAAIWADLRDDYGEPVEGMFSDDITPESRERVTALVTRFLAAAAPLLAQTDLSDGDVGHNLWLTAAGHGTGFWDRGLGAVGDALTKLTKDYVLYVEVGSDGLLHFS